MGLKGKFVRREGTALIFGSRAKPEWRPIESSGHIDPLGLEQGSYYELETQGNQLTGYRKLDGDARDHAPNDRAQMQAPGGGTNATSGNLMASATGFAKSAMESGICKTVPDAIRAGLAWGRLWGEVPSDPVDSRPQPTRSDFDDESF